MYASFGTGNNYFYPGASPATAGTDSAIKNPNSGFNFADRIIKRSKAGSKRDDSGNKNNPQTS
jgi:hypothetical protein